MDTAVALKLEGDDYAAAMIEQFEEKMVRTVGREDCVSIIEYPEGTTDFAPYFDEIETTSSMAVFFPAEPAVADEVIYQAVSTNYSFLWIGDESWANILEVNNNPLRDNTMYLDGISYISGFDESASLSEMTPIFIDAYKKKYGRDQVPSNATALGFDAYLLALNAIKESGTFDEKTMIANKLNNTFEMPGATGYITLNAQGDSIKDVVIDQYVKGKVRVVYTAVPVWGQ
jgi:branched-chain amino acid transport system substrate-binding protein